MTGDYQQNSNSPKEVSVYVKDKFEGNLARQVSSLHLIRKTWKELSTQFKGMTFNRPSVKGEDQPQCVQRLPPAGLDPPTFPLNNMFCLTWFIPNT